jgi:hypothetical protein
MFWQCMVGDGSLRVFQPVKNGFYFDMTIAFESRVKFQTNLKKLSF